jgi:hypothetical protein
VYEPVKSNTLFDLPSLDVSTLYLLAAPLTPKPVRQIASKVAASGSPRPYHHRLVFRRDVTSA